MGVADGGWTAVRPARGRCGRSKGAGARVVQRHEAVGTTSIDSLAKVNRGELDPDPADRKLGDRDASDR